MFTNHSKTDVTVKRDSVEQLKADCARSLATLHPMAQLEAMIRFQQVGPKFHDEYSRYNHFWLMIELMRK